LEINVYIEEICILQFVRLHLKAEKQCSCLWNVSVCECVSMSVYGCLWIYACKILLYENLLKSLSVQDFLTYCYNCLLTELVLT